MRVLFAMVLCGFVALILVGLLTLWGHAHAWVLASGMMASYVVGMLLFEGLVAFCERARGVGRCANPETIYTLLLPTVVCVGVAALSRYDHATLYLLPAALLPQIGMIGATLVQRAATTIAAIDRDRQP
ncbi:hypothetical protein [Acidihalobacter ferrooxydans]|uniref:Uncharacterized protein n=1 Tax=Acidihalobacter ferrooxydans TaxID=1765967 RepID=A0A1P8UDL3_9GAMM|nr:hypothetical protein [Acidihalobacter ferrooxydans]APZ41886.1 hypothetical protein BW247_01210 [Acidihalobacter ferrooxydans]